MKGVVMALLNPAPVKSSLFTWHPGSRMFSAEMSDLPGFGRVWDDACDEGLTLVSDRLPGQPSIVLTVEHEERDVDNDVRWWDLRPADLSQRQQVPFTVRVWND